jgi:predicted NAD/FAD-dependent oxidoreductase
MKKPRIAIIGAGLSGVILGQELQEISAVKIFEKSRGCGGRMSVRYAENFAFDHGAQFFTAENENFKKFLRPFLELNVVSQWMGKVISFKSNEVIAEKSEESYLVPSPNMNSLCKKMADGIDISLGVEIAPIFLKDADGWHLKDKSGNHLGVYDFVISTAPLFQTKNLFANLDLNLEAKGVVMLPSFATMIGFNQKLNLDWIFAEVEDEVVKSISFNSSKPGRDKNVSCFVIHSAESWSIEHLENDVSNVEKVLVKKFEDLTRISCNKADYISTHRWRYALSCNSQKSEPFFDENLKIGATGDWVFGSKIEDVYLAAENLAHLIKSKI